MLAFWRLTLNKIVHIRIQCAPHRVKRAFFRNTFRFVLSEIIGKVKQSLLQAYVAQRVGRGIDLLFLDRGTRRGWVVSSTPRPHLTPGKDTVPILQEAGWATGPVWTGGKTRPHRDSIPDRPARSQSLYRLRYPAHRNNRCLLKKSHTLRAK